MGEAKRKREAQAGKNWPGGHHFRDTLQLHWLPATPQITAARIEELTGKGVASSTPLVLNAFRAVVGDRTFQVGFCLGDGERFSAVGVAVIDRLTMDESEATLHVVAIRHADVAWDIVMRHLRSFEGKVLLFAFPDSDVYDAGTAEMFYSKQIRVFDPEGKELLPLSAARRREIHAQAAVIQNRPVPPFYATDGLNAEDVPWVFRFTTPAGKVIRVAAWNGRRDYAHEFPEDVLRWVGGARVAIVQVEKPVGVDGRSSLKLTHWLAQEFDAVIHWARDTETFDSILKSFIRLDLDSVAPPELSEDWKPDVTILSARSAPESCN
jgi:hypothetical protein